MSILLVTNQKDLTTDFLVREFKKRSLEFSRLNTEIASNCFVVLNPQSNSIEIRDKHSYISTHSISVAYFRRPAISQMRNTVGAYRSYALTEWNTFLTAFYTSIGDRWFSHPNNILLAEDKPRQLRLARNIGFNVPQTIITNDLTAIKQIEGDYSLVAKPLRQSLVVDSHNSEKVIFTSRIDLLTEEDRTAISLCPIIFQRQIPKAADIRVTVVGNLVFAVSIHSQEWEESKVDWRRGSNSHLRHEVIDLPNDIVEKCIRIVRSQFLRFGAIDLVQDPDGKIWFLECNPNGQWAWIENRTGLPISAAITDEMLKMMNNSE